MRFRRWAFVAIPGLLMGCTDVPLVRGDNVYPQIAALNTYPMPLCIFLCTTHISAIREDVVSTGGAALTTGAKSTSQTTSTTGGN